MTRNLQIEEFDEPERYELREPSSYEFDLNRREVMQVLGAGLLVSVTSEVSLGQSRSGERRSGQTLSGRLHIAADGVITVMTSKVELGQGSRTSLTQAAAEELRVSADRIRMVMADTDVVPDDGGTAGSRTTPSTSPRIRKAAAAARELLIDLAAQRWQTNRDSLTARDGKIVDASKKRQVGYGELATDKNFLKETDRKIGDEVSVTRVTEWRVLGTPVSKIDGRDLVTGAHRYPSDMTSPEMLYGKILRPPSFGATLESIDLGRAQAMEGVTVVRDGDFVGCAAPTSARAEAAMESIRTTAQWKCPPQPSGNDLFSRLKKQSQQGLLSRRRPRVQTKGSIENALAAAKKVHRASYQIAYIAHAPMEPRAALAQWKDEKLTVWMGSQQPARAHSELAKTFRIPSNQVRVVVPDTGGGFGGKHTAEVAVEAARLARAAKRPVSLTWTRQEEFTWAYFRPAGLIEVQAGLNDTGTVIGWDFTNYNSGASAIATPYNIPNTRTKFVNCDSPLRQGSYRALAATANVFARESFMDELASAANADPVKFRLQHLENDRLHAVLESAAKRFDWPGRKATKSSPDRGIGVACGTEKGSYTAACVEIEVDRRSGEIRVLQVCQAFECGAIQNPANLRSQVEGCIIMGLGAAMREEIEFENGRVLNASFARYAVPRFRDVPEIETILLNRPDLPSAGAGETPIVAIAPAVANAVFDATGKRVHSMPIKINA